MIYITTNHGTGDTYMTLAFAKAVERHRGQQVKVQIPPQHAAIAAMFPDVSTGDPDVMNMGDDLIVAHPSSVPKRVRIDHLCLLSRRLTHADLWRAMLELPADEPMPRGQYEYHVTRLPRRVFLIPNSRSMPNSRPEFWTRLEQRLASEGWDVRVNLEAHPLKTMFQEAENAEWVIGPQCGVMMILCHALFPCRKTFATPSLDGHPYFKRTYPYAYVETFAGENYADVDEIKITSDIDGAVDLVVLGMHNRGRKGLTEGVEVLLSHGDFLDRYSVLSVKMDRLPPEKRALIVRDYLRHKETAEIVFSHHGIHLREVYNTLKGINLAAFDQNDVAVRTVLDGGHAIDHYAAAVHLNKRRTELKDEINRICRSVYGEVKSYYGGENP